MPEVTGASPPRCKLCGKRHWALCDNVYDPKELLTKIPKNQSGRKVHVRHMLETDHLAEELDSDVKPKRSKKK